MPDSRFRRAAARRLLVSAVVVGALASSAVAAAVPAEATTTSPTLSISGSHSLVSGEVRTLKVDAPASAKGATVRVQVATGSKWSTLISKRANSKGDITVSLRLTGVGSVRYRAQIAKTKHFRAATTKSASVSISKWFYLADMSVISHGSLGTDRQQANLAGVAYIHSVEDYFADEWGNHGYASFNLGYHCTRFVSAVGPNDDDSVSIPALDSVLIDGVSVASYSTTVGHPAAVDLDVTGGFRITIDDVWDHSSSKSYGGGNVVWGDARVLCTSDVTSAS